MAVQHSFWKLKDWTSDLRHAFRLVDSYKDKGLPCLWPPAAAES
jgi:hypothetical protein